MSTISNITDRDSYVVFRMAWKTSYKQLSKEIRELKLLVKQTMRVSIHHAGSLQNALRYLQGRATEEMEALKEAKALLKAMPEEVAKAA